MLPALTDRCAILVQKATSGRAAGNVATEKANSPSHSTKTAGNQASRQANPVAARAGSNGVGIDSDLGARGSSAARPHCQDKEWVHAEAADTSEGSQLAGLRRKAKVKDSCSATASDPKHKDIFVEEYSGGSGYEASDVRSSESVHVNGYESKRGSKSTLESLHCSSGESEQLGASVVAGQTEKDEQPGKAVAEAGAAEESHALPAHIDPMKCARDFMAEVQRRSATSNIVAATWTGAFATICTIPAASIH
jgi:hypothetical protein